MEILDENAMNVRKNYENTSKMRSECMLILMFFTMLEM